MQATTEQPREGFWQRFRREPIPAGLFVLLPWIIFVGPDMMAGLISDAPIPEARTTEERLQNLHRIGLGVIVFLSFVLYALWRIVRALEARPKV